MSSLNDVQVNADLKAALEDLSIWARHVDMLDPIHYCTVRGSARIDVRRVWIDPMMGNAKAAAYDVRLRVIGSARYDKLFNGPERFWLCSTAKSVMLHIESAVRLVEGD